MIAIPEAVYKTWRYNSKFEVPDVDKIDFTNSHVLTFEILKKENERFPTLIKFKAPLRGISFGDLYYMYLYEYNERNRENPIEYLNQTRDAYEWTFSIKPKHWWNQKVYIDPSLSVIENRINEDSIILSERVVN